MKLSPETRETEHALQSFITRLDRLYLRRRGLNPDKYPPISLADYEEERRKILDEMRDLEQTPEYAAWLAATADALRKQ